MNAPEKLQIPSLLDHYPDHEQALLIFPLESLQNLDIDSALRCQTMLGHGGTFGIWETPKAMVPHMRNSARRIDFRRRIASYIPNETSASSSLDALLDEGVMWLTRLALLMRMGPAGLAGTAKFKPLDASTISRLINCEFAHLVALGTTSRLDSTNPYSTDFASALTAQDLRTCWAKENMRDQLKRLTQLRSLGLWSDAPEAREFKGKSTAVRGMPNPSQPERKRTPSPPIPDDFLAAMGPRVLWLIKDLGPNLIHLLENLPDLLGSVNANNQSINRRINNYFAANNWHDRNGQLIDKPPFILKHGSDRGKHFRSVPFELNHAEWPPKNWSSVQSLAVSLQTAHMWLALLVMAARIGEVATIGRNCVEFARDGQPYANGKTYKASRALSGKEREWPIPDFLVDVFAQQVKLVEACERIARMIKYTDEMENDFSDRTHLWASLGASTNSDATQKLEIFGENLQTLALRMDLTNKPGGKNLHPHRFRKTLARLAGLAIDGSQKVLMLLLGHDDVTTTLGYMQSDRAFAKEVDDMTRELRIMRGEALIEDMRAALLDPSGLPYGGHGGGGAPVLVDSVHAYEEELHRTGEEWGVNTARELSILLTNNGESARLISAHVVCTKTAGEVGLCSKKKGAIVAGNCQTECSNRIEDKTGRRDTERVIPILVQHAQENIANNDWLPLASNKKQLEQELKRYDDIGEKWRAEPEVQAILEAAT